MGWPPYLGSLIPEPTWQRFGVKPRTVCGELPRLTAFRERSMEAMAELPGSTG
jgi:hypothetical protein